MWQRNQTSRGPVLGYWTGILDRALSFMPLQQTRNLPGDRHTFFQFHGDLSKDRIIQDSTKDRIIQDSTIVLRTG